MSVRYWLSVGEWGQGGAGKDMLVYSNVQMDDDDGDANDRWICDSFAKKIGSGSGFWMRRISTKEILLIDDHRMTIEATLKYSRWPLQRSDFGDINLKGEIYGKHKLKYWVSILNQPGY